MGKIRLILALAVVATHCGPILGCDLVGGRLAVQAFFMISGFYMSLILNEKYIGSNKSFKLFITNRLLRLYPIYWAILIMVVAGGLLFALKSHTFHVQKFEGYFALHGYIPSFLYIFGTQLVMWGQDLVYFLGINSANGHLYFTAHASNSTPMVITLIMIPQAWSIGIELTFYLIAPFILRKNITFVTILILLSLALRLYIYNALKLQNDPWDDRFFPTELIFFLLGFISYHIYTKLKDKIVSKSIGYAMLTIVLLETFLYPLFPLYNITYWPFYIGDTTYFISMIVAMPFLFKCFKGDKLDIQIGDLSYPIYMSHKFIYYIFKQAPFFANHMGFYVAVGATIMGICLNKWVTLPIEKYRQSRLKRPVLAAPQTT